MKISVLLPTRDRLALLREAVASTRRLDDPDWEVVISDNYSSEDVEGFVASLHDERVKYVRTKGPLSVTENWNNAIAHSSGDYVIMLGDDDALLGGYFARTRRVIADFGHPQVIYHNALCYAHAGVIPGEPDGFLRSEGYARFLRDAEQPFLLPHEEAHLLVRRAMNFRLSYGLNMQFVTISRSIVEELSHGGSFFRSPFPDYYAMNHLFERARSIVVEPRPLVVIGVSPRSYGYFYNNQRETEGRSFLEGGQSSEAPTADRSNLLPGTNINNGWLRAMEELHLRLGSPTDLKPNYRRYRMLQTVHVYEGYYLRDTVSASDLADLREHLTASRRRLYDFLFAVLAKLARVAPPGAQLYIRGAVSAAARQFPWWDPVHDTHRYRDIVEVSERVNCSECPTRWETQRGSRLRAEILRRLLPR